MIPGAHIPPRRQGEYHHYQYPQTHSPVHHNPYAYHPQQHYGPPHAYYAPPQYPYHHPQQQYAMPNPMPPRQFQPHSPVVVSSQPYMQPMPPPVNRQLGQTPPIVHSRTPPVMPRHHTPQPGPSTPSATSQTQVSSPRSSTNMTTPTPPPPPPESKPRITLPWYSSGTAADFPPRRSQKKRKKRAAVPATDAGLEFPTREQPTTEEHNGTEENATAANTPVGERAESQTSTAGPVSDIDTPATSQVPSEAEAPEAPSSAMPPPSSRPQTETTHKRTTTKPAVPLIPIKPSVPASVTSATQKSAKAEEEGKNAETSAGSSTDPSSKTEATETAPSPPPKAAPKSWAELLRSKAAATPAAQGPTAPNGVVVVNGNTNARSNSLTDVLSSFSVDSEKKIAFLEPRGLVNSGNLCYMNSILQVLLFCVPFYDFLDQVAKRAVHSFKNETPLVDAMILFMRDFKVIDSAAGVEKLRLRLKDAELEQYGDPLSPEYVYEAIKRLPRFDHMKRGQQEDAEEFLGFLLAGLHDECAHVIKCSRSNDTPDDITSPKSNRSDSVEGGWLEVGPKQKATVTQSSGTIEVETPVTKIFGGKLRSEYRKPGDKPSVTLEPYQPLQLDIGSPNVHNITDALKGLTHLETLDSTVRGARASTKQVFIETLPPVLILHLKRFQYDVKGAQKIYKKVGYPLELEIPKEVFPLHKRNSFGVRGGLPRYRLTGVVYHHGKNASGGHYTVDLRRQEGREWIRMDDTVIRRIRAEDVAEGGSEEDPKVLAAALEQHKHDSRNQNIYEKFGQDTERAEQGGWSQVNGADKHTKDSGGKKWSGVVNGTTTPNSAGKRTPLTRDNIKDNKVAYILFYEKI